MIHYDEHPPPHIHIYKAGRDCRLDIETLVELPGKFVLPAKVLRQVREWANIGDRRAQMLTAWEACIACEHPKRIA